MVSAITSSTNEPAKYLILVNTVQLEPMIKAQISGRFLSNGISDVATASVHSEKKRLKKLMMMMKMIFYYDDEYIARNDGFSRMPEIDSAMKLRPEK